MHTRTVAFTAVLSFLLKKEAVGFLVCHPLENASLFSPVERSYAQILSRRQRRPWPCRRISIERQCCRSISDRTQLHSRTTEYSVSDSVLHVGNLDWNRSSDEVSQLLLRALSSVSKNTVQIAVKKIETPVRTRDQRKHHGGSATLSFSTPRQALAALTSLRQLTNLRVRFATFRSVEAEQNVSEERVAKRRKRAESYARRRRAVAHRIDALLDSISIPNDSQVLLAPVLDWTECPAEMDPVRGGGLQSGSQRGHRKQAAVEAFLYVLREALLSPLFHGHVADLASGAGNLSLPLAWWLKKDAHRRVLAVDFNSFALQRLQQRADDAGLDISTLHLDLAQVLSSGTARIDCAAVVSLHACGSASDLAMEVAVAQGLPFCISPCCIGKIASNEVRMGHRMPTVAPTVIVYPRSSWLKDMMDLSDYKLLACAADYGVGTTVIGKEELDRQLRCKKAKRVIETDRLEWARERGYYVRMMELPRIGPYYPKREILLGAKIGTRAAFKISQLASTTTRLYAVPPPGEEEELLMDDHHDEEEMGDKMDKFDSKGLSGYLVPYALSFLLSVIVTGAFVKFVLMEQ